MESRKSIIIKPEEVPVRPDVLNIAHLPPVEKELNSKYSRVTQQEAEALLAWIESSKESEPLAVPEKLDVPKPAEKATERSSRFDSIKKTFRGAYERFISRFKGEVQPEDEKGAEKRWGDVAKNAATGFLSVVATYTGAKLVADLPQWLYQKYWTNPAERQRIKEALASKEKETDETAEPTIIDQKKARLEEAIHASKFLTAEKKLELLAKLKDTVETYEKEEKALRTERDQKIAQLLDEAIQTRVKNTVVLKEALNSALMVTGLSAMRGVAYGSVSLYERYKEVSQERREGKRTGGQFNEWIVKGVTETAHKLVGGGAETWIGKGMNVVQGATTVLRAAGFTELAISEYMNEGGSKLIETSLKAFEQKGMLEAAKANIAAPWERLGHGTQWIREKTMGTPSATETPSGTVLSEKPITETTKAAPAEPVAPEGAATGMAAGELARAAHETFGETEFSEAQIELGTVKPGDGIVELMERQGVHPDEALRTAREAGIVRGGGDTRLTTEAIYRISVLAKMTPDGHAMISFIDKTTGSELSLEDLREQGLVREHGTVPGEIATHSEKIQATMERGSSVRLETGPGPEASLEVPHKLSGGRLELFTKNGRLTSMDTGIDRLTPDEKALIKNLFEKIPNKNEKVAESIDLFISGTTRRIQETVSLEALLTRLEEKGFGDSIEAQMVRNTLLGNQESFKWMGPGILHEEKLANIANEKVRLNTTLLEKGVPEADRIGDIRIRGLGKVEFLYDADGKPSLDWKKLTEEAGRSLQKRASSLLVEGWEGTLRNAVLVEMNTVVEKQQLQIGGKLLLMHEALRELETEKHGNSPEAQYIREQMKTFLIKNGAALDQDNILLKEMIKESGAQNRMPIAIPAPERVDHAISPVAVQDTEEIHEPLKAFKSDAGKVKFSYNPDGSVDDAYIPAYTPKREAVERALADWGLTKDQVKQYFFDRRGGLWEPSERGTGAYVGTSQSHLDTSARGMSERLIKDVERLARQEATLVAMEKAGLQTTPEYQYWRQETTEFRQYVRKELKPLIPRTV
ncbi:hypothetical protein HYV70_01895 [Candidatus Uhrbacteria bacterium]|nr:hypothetical protein [Candidatus Uhrbacteria bacterium]